MLFLSIIMHLCFLKQDKYIIYSVKEKYVNIILKQ